MLTAMTLNDLRKLDQGKVAAMFERELKKAVFDIKDRPGDDSKRTVTLIATMTPAEIDQVGIVESIDIDFCVKSRIPAHQTRGYNMSPSKGGDLLFNAESDDNALQGTIDDEISRNKNEEQKGGDE